MRTFRAIDGRRVPMNEEQRKELKFVAIASVVAPILTILVFALSAGVI